MTKSSAEDPSIPPEPARWPLDLAAARLEELVARAGREGPQRLTMDGRDVAVVTAVTSGAVKPLTGQDIIDAMQRCPDPDFEFGRESFPYDDRDVDR